MRTSRFHGRHEGAERTCDAPGCREPGEFRAPGPRASSFDGPGDWRWFCLDHVREFNSGYDWFEGMSAEEMLAAHHPAAGWQRDTRAFNASRAFDGMPRWADYDDPLDAINARAAGIRDRARHQAERAMAAAENAGGFDREEIAALQTMGLGRDTDRRRLRRRYTELVRRYHPDQNGGDRAYEERLGRVVEAYQLLRKSAAIG
ncbi:DnaJ domain-containing protein [Altererythrobacter sp. CAU 1778]